MKLKSGIMALVLAALPSLPLAAGCPFSGHSQAQSCADGHAWDPGSKSCVKQTTS
ncbi:hypothetical protein ROG8370_03537 [Roseovarius gaetbuli]|uniref:Chitin-binding type-2 domain-containing protein n=1 Tax=Roseovarius gaetbuli TaxID=1356575 RepID=A0A1X7AAA9_9RHOB|nr:hypothetical protein [Roseovarius gaetbuli]SLN72751.1 hypothetical protein ROG8370_03537 [Roseovarius gaetbuli]